MSERTFVRAIPRDSEHRTAPDPGDAPVPDTVVAGLREATAALRAARQPTQGAADELGGRGTEPAQVVDATYALLDALDGLLIHQLSRRPGPDDLTRLAATLREVRDLTAPHAATPAPPTAAGTGEPAADGPIR